MSKEKNQVPDYYNNAELWAVCFDINPSYYSEKLKQELGQDIKNFYKNVEVQRFVEKKSYYDYMHLMMQHIFSLPYFDVRSYMDNSGRSALHLACEYQFDSKCIKNLLMQMDKQKINILELKDQYRKNPAHIAADTVNISALSLIANHAPSILSSHDVKGLTPYNYLLEGINKKIGEHNLSNHKLSEFITYAKLLDKSKYDISEYRFGNSATLAHELLIAKNIKGFNMLVEAFPEFLLKKNAQQLTPIELAKTLNLREGIKTEKKNSNNNQFLGQFDKHKSTKPAQEKQPEKFVSSKNKSPK